MARAVRRQLQRIRMKKMNCSILWSDQMEATHINNRKYRVLERNISDSQRGIVWRFAVWFWDLGGSDRRRGIIFRGSNVSIEQCRAILTAKRIDYIWYDTRLWRICERDKSIRHTYGAKLGSKCGSSGNGACETRKVHNCQIVKIYMTWPPWT